MQAIVSKEMKMENKYKIKIIFLPGDIFKGDNKVRLWGGGEKYTRKQK